MPDSPTIESALAMQRAGQLTATALVEEALARMAATADLNAIAACDPERPRAEAARLDLLRAGGGWAGPLHGVPVTIKDLFAVDGLPTRAGTRAPLPPLGGEGGAVARLRAAGAVILAKTNMHEIALGLTGENDWTGDVRNPLDPERQAGGSSSGSAVAVATGVGLASLGTDTGGSIRAPAALCGVVGFKPTHGLVPMDGALPLSPTCDHGGPIARSVADARLVAEVLTGRRLDDPEAVAAPPVLGVPRAYLEGRLSIPVRAAFEALLERLVSQGAQLVDVVVPDLDLTAATYTPLVRAEAAYVHRAALEAGGEGFSAPVREGLMFGQSLRAVDYLEARAMRRRVAAGVETAFHTPIAGLILPATPTAAVPRGTVTVALESGDAPHRAAQLALTAPFSLVGVPVACLPFDAVEGLPLGVQIVTPWQQDARALAIAAWMEGSLRA